MTRNRSNRGRRRNRGRSNAPAEQGSPQQAETLLEAPAPAEEMPQAEPSAPSTDRRSRRPERPYQARREDAPQGGGPRGARPQGERREDGRPGVGGRERPGRRRQGRARQQLQPIGGEVLKPRLQVIGDRGPAYKRSIAELDSPDGPVLGCPMLSRTRLGLPFIGGRQAPRCALAWALHSETEASYCMETPDLTQCWKAHPERLDEIRERLAERAAD